MTRSQAYILKSTFNISSIKLPFVLSFLPSYSTIMANINNPNNNVTNSLNPPTHVRGMTVLDRDKFGIVTDVPYVSIPVKSTKTAMKIIKPLLLKIPKINPVRTEEESRRHLLLHPLKIQEFETYQKKFKDLYDLKILWTKINLQYENWTSEEIFKAVLPKDSVGNVSSFSIIGHIIHLNLKSEISDFKQLIGQVLLDKYTNIKTVVNKCEIIDNTFRNFKMEHLCGEQNYQVLVKENGFQYEFDFQKVFWNPRLGKEHNDMTCKFKSKDIVYDVFAGVGPFAIPMSKKGCRVYANDLNPDSYYWLCHNAKLNKVLENLTAYNMDGSDFIKTIVKQGLIEYFNSDEMNNSHIHILMNLPALALTFLNSFKGLLNGQTFKNINNLPTVHCYFFKKKDEDVGDVVGNFLDQDLLNTSEIYVVRVVAPNKLMMRLSYELPKSVLFSDTSIIHEPPTKKFKISSESEELSNLHGKVVDC